MSIITRVIQWNSARYDQVCNTELTAELLFEEAAEYNDARSGTEVDQLDALCDVIYVAIGAMWKMGLNATQIEEALSAVCDANDSKIIDCVADNIKANIDKGPDFVPPEARLQEILNARS